MPALHQMPKPTLKTWLTAPTISSSVSVSSTPPSPRPCSTITWSSCVGESSVLLCGWVVSPHVWVSRQSSCVGESSVLMCGWVVSPHVWVSRQSSCVGESSVLLCGWVVSPHVWVSRQSSCVGESSASSCYLGWIHIPRRLLISVPCPPGMKRKY